ncbi:MAG: hypothetical protein WCH76_08180 [Candidatus Riflemargulisbacteria bacterium]
MSLAIEIYGQRGVVIPNCLAVATTASGDTISTNLIEIVFMDFSSALRIGILPS